MPLYFDSLTESEFILSSKKFAERVRLDTKNDINYEWIQFNS